MGKWHSAFGEPFEEKTHSELGIFLELLRNNERGTKLLVPADLLDKKAAY